jgi:hypothetical protein
MSEATMPDRPDPDEQPEPADDDDDDEAADISEPWALDHPADTEGGEE